MFEGFQGPAHIVSPHESCLPLLGETLHEMLWSITGPPLSLGVFFGILINMLMCLVGLGVLPSYPLGSSSERSAMPAKELPG